MRFLTPITKPLAIAICSIGVLSSCGLSEDSPFRYQDDVLPITVTFPATPDHIQSETSPHYRCMVQCKTEGMGYWLKLEENANVYNAAEKQIANNQFALQMTQQGFSEDYSTDTIFKGLPAIYAQNSKGDDQVHMLMCFDGNVRIEASAMLNDNGLSKHLIDTFFQTLEFR